MGRGTFAEVDTPWPLRVYERVARTTSNVATQSIPASKSRGPSPLKVIPPSQLRYITVDGMGHGVFRNFNDPATLNRFVYFVITSHEFDIYPL